MAYENLLYEVQEPVAIITLNRPEALNALSPALEAELHVAPDEADQDDAVCVIILTGAGRAFSAGYDISGRAAPDQPERRRPTHSDPPSKLIKSWWLNDLGNIQKLLHTAYLSKPVIAAVNGWAMGGGCWYSLICDITIDSDRGLRPARGPHDLQPDLPAGRPFRWPGHGETSPSPSRRGG